MLLIEKGASEIIWREIIATNQLFAYEAIVY